MALVSLLLVCGLSLKAQNNTEETEGKVSFTTSQSVYVKYTSTDGIIAGDTLYSSMNDQLVPALIVKNLSSTSIVSTPINDFKFNVNDKIIARRRIIKKEPVIEHPVVIQNIVTTDTTHASQKIQKTSKPNSGKQKIFGYASISNYSNFSNTPVNHNSFVINYAVSFNINNIGNSKFSLASNLLFRQQSGEWAQVQKNIFNGLKIYNLSVRYDINKSLFLVLGRRINPNISNIGAIDGLQAEKWFKGFYMGAFAGSRPNSLDYGFNFNLLQFGGYIGYNMQTPKRNMQNSLAFVEQMNTMKTDRRFLYFQHSSSLLKNVNLFVTMEMDLYKVVNEQKQNTFNLTNLYASLRWRPIKKLTLSGTYDARNNVIYYETDKNYLTTLLEMQTRQGLAFYGNYTITKNLFIGVRAGYRFQKKDLKPSKNAYLFITWSDISRSLLSATLSSTILETNYLQGNIINLRLNRPFLSGRMNLGCAYSYVNYKILNSEGNFRQHIAEINFSTEIVKRFSIALNLEGDFEKKNQFYRAYIQLRKRF
ncbi:MAG: hypothetical protein WCL06_03045 [Bacteroidota bacterium]